MKKLYTIVTLFIAAPACAAQDLNHLSGQAVITQPVLELNRHEPHDVTDTSFPASPETKKCYRDHQALLNEHVRIVETNGDAVKIALDSLLYDIDSSTQQPINTFWTSSKYLATFDYLKNNNLLSALANPTYGQEPTIVLTYPWNNFSVGTRFKHVPDNDTQDSYAIVRIDYTNNTVVSDLVPHDCAHIEVKPENAHAARQAFVSMINTFLDRVDRDGVVPFVWGGSSFLHPYDKDEKCHIQDGVWRRDGSENKLYYGYDASEFVMRMAQIAGINFPYKTTWSMQQGLAHLSPTDQLEEGDLLWVPGGVAIVSSLEKNEMVMAHGYNSGYGCVHKLPLAQCFQGISTYADLMADYHAGKPLIILDRNGAVSKTCTTFKFLKLPSSSIAEQASTSSL